MKFVLTLVFCDPPAPTKGTDADLDDVEETENNFLGDSNKESIISSTELIFSLDVGSFKQAVMQLCQCHIQI